jgi:peptidoglycan hydrolase-like protein with peptidoglycan-binding domain
MPEPFPGRRLGIAVNSEGDAGADRAEPEVRVPAAQAKPRSSRSRTRFTALATASAMLLPFLAGCQTRPQVAYDAAQPSTRAVHNIGNFNEALRCMDDMFLAQGKRDIYITTAGIPDATGLIAAGTKEMFISAVSRMSATSNAFRFVDYDPTQTDVQILSELIGLRDDFVAPNYYIRGAITQLDTNVLQASGSAGVSIPFVDLGVTANQVVSVVSIDLNVGKLTTRQIIPGLSAANSIAVVQSGKGADVGGLIGKAGLSLSVSLDKAEGFHQAVRNLIELSTIEILGKLTRVPYWQCLSIASTNPSFRNEARGWFDIMGTGERERFVQGRLVTAGYLRGADQAPGPALTDAIARYQAENDLVPSGRIDFDLYYRLLAAESRHPAVAAAAVAPPPVETAAAAISTVEPPRLVIGTPRGPKPVYHVGDTLAMTVQPTENAFVYCFYQDATGTVARVFPNRFQANAFVPARTQIDIPPPGRHSFAIRFDRPGAQEQVACVAAEREIGLRLPDQLKKQDLEPLPVSGLDDVVNRFREMSPGQIDDARLTVDVAR